MRAFDRVGGRSVREREVLGRLLAVLCCLEFKIPPLAFLQAGQTGAFDWLNHFTVPVGMIFSFHDIRLERRPVRCS